MIERTHHKLPITQQCALLGISRSSAYYSHRDALHERDRKIVSTIREVMNRYPFFGYRKVFLELNRRQKRAVTSKQVRRIMARAGLKAIYPGYNLSKARQEHKKYPYLLTGKSIRYPNQVWSTDLTYIKVSSGHMYLMAIIDLYSRKVLNWVLSNTLEALIFAQCLRDTLKQYGSPAIFNTDQGCQFTSECWTQVLKEHYIRISMDGKNRALDNIYIERLWRSVKYEDLYLKQYESVKALKEGINRYFQFYNEERFHQGIDYQTPDERYESFKVVDLITNRAA